MVYSEAVKKAMTIAYKAHEGQVDKGGYPYIFHPLHIAEKMENEIEIIVALLHDVAEDTKITFEEMEAEGIPVAAIEALKLLCHNKEIPYMDYIKAMQNNIVAMRVKRQDLLHNMDISRCPNNKEKAMSRYKKYEKALELLKSQIQAYRENQPL